MTIDQMKQRLRDSFPTARLVDVTDLTGTEDHWDVYVESAEFASLSRIDRQRRVMDAFAPELKTGEVHALSIRTQT